MADETSARPGLVTPDPWLDLAAFTAARIGLGRCGVSQPLAASLAFRLAHAQARDAVWTPLDADRLAADLAAACGPCLRLHSRAVDRLEYLTRPDLGRRLDDTSLALLARQPTDFDLCLVVADGLSARAVQEHAAPFLARFAPLAVSAGFRLAPLCLVEQGRVAVADAVAHALGARLAVVLIGERPGLSSPDSMGIYMTWSPKPGVTDEARNCISNVRPAGLPIAEGVRKLAYLVENAFAGRRSGVQLKDRMEANYLPFAVPVPGLGR